MKKLLVLLFLFLFTVKGVFAQNIQIKGYS